MDMPPNANAMASSSSAAADDLIPQQLVQENMDNDNGLLAATEANTDTNAPEMESFVSSVSTNDRIKWMQEKAFPKSRDLNDNHGPEPTINDVNSTELTSDKVKWLQEQAFHKTQNQSQPPNVISNELTTDKVKWLQEQAFSKQKHQHNEGATLVSNELTTDKVKWLQEQAFHKQQNTNIQKDEALAKSVSNELTTDKVRWLQEQAFPKKNTDMPPSNLGQQQQQQKNEQQHLSDDDFDSANESQDESESDEESQEELFVDAASDMPQGQDTNDLYALLAYSKGRIQDRNLEVEGDDNNDDDDDGQDQDEDQDDHNNGIQQEQSHQHSKSESNHELDDDLPEDSSISHESFDGLDDDNDDNRGNDSAVKEESPNTDTTNSTTNSTTNTVADTVADTDPNRIAMSTRDFRKQQKQKETDELWALLNYSKVRLATGATPTNEEAQALGMSHDNDVMGTSDREDIGESTEVRKVPPTSEYDHNRDDYSDRDEDSFDSDASDGSSSEDVDGDNELNMSTEINHHEIAASRARALAALERTKNIGMDNDHDAVSNLRPKTKSQSPVKTGVGGAGMLTEQQLLKSIALAEEEARNGATEFSTRNKLSLLDKVKTPNFKRGRGRGNEGGANRDVTVEVNNFKEKARIFWKDSKKKAEKTMKDIKANVAKVEKQPKNQMHKGLPSAGVRLKETSPFKNFSQNIAKVEKMDQEKYGNSTHFV